jgi:hypothetical protein
MYSMPYMRAEYPFMTDSHVLAARGKSIASLCLGW